MTDLSTATDHVDYEGFEIHVVPATLPGSDTRYTYTGYVCHPGVNPALPGLFSQMMDTVCQPAGSTACSV